MRTGLDALAANIWIAVAKLRFRMARLGRTPLKDHMVTPTTLERYQVAIDDLHTRRIAHRSLPSTLSRLDGSVAEYIESLWAEGSSLGVVGDTLSS